MKLKFNSRVNYIISSHQSDKGSTYFKVYTSSGVFLFHSMLIQDSRKYWNL